MAGRVTPWHTNTEHNPEHVDKAAWVSLAKRGYATDRTLTESTGQATVVVRIGGCVTPLALHTGEPPADRITANITIFYRSQCSAKHIKSTANLAMAGWPV